MFKVGDEVRYTDRCGRENCEGCCIAGEVVEVDDDGVSVQWGNAPYTGRYRADTRMIELDI